MFWKFNHWPCELGPAHPWWAPILKVSPLFSGGPLLPAASETPLSLVPSLEGRAHTSNINALLPPSGSSCPLRLPQTLNPKQDPLAPALRQDQRFLRLNNLSLSHSSLLEHKGTQVRASRASRPAAPSSSRIRVFSLPSAVPAGWWWVMLGKWVFPWLCGSI